MFKYTLEFDTSYMVDIGRKSRGSEQSEKRRTTPTCKPWDPNLSTADPEAGTTTPAAPLAPLPKEPPTPKGDDKKTTTRPHAVLPGN